MINLTTDFHGQFAFRKNNFIRIIFELYSQQNNK